MSINLIENITFRGDDKTSFKLILRTALNIAFHAPNNTGERYNNLYIALPPSWTSYWKDVPGNENMELVCVIHSQTHLYESTAKSTEKYPMISTPNMSKEKDFCRENVWAESSYQAVIDRVMVLVKPGLLPKAPVPDWMLDGDGSDGPGFVLYYSNGFMYIAKNHIYYGK